MSTSKYFDRICIIGAIVMLIMAVSLFALYRVDGVSNTKTLGYEDRIFDNSRVHTIDIVMDDWDSFIEGCENEEYSNCSLVIDNEAVKNVGIRAKGNTSLSNVKMLGSERYSFKIEFDCYEKGKTYYGLDKLCLNNLIQDNTMMKDYVVYQMMNDFSVDSPLCSYVYISVNGEEWGLYLAVEGVEESFISRNYSDSSGKLYKPESSMNRGGRGGMPESPEGMDFSNMQPPEGMDFPNMQPPEGMDFSNMQPPEGMDFSNMQPSEGTDSANTRAKENDNQNDAVSGATEQKKQDFHGGPGGMASDDVKLNYTDDEFDSYSNIFDMAKSDISDVDKSRLIKSLKSLSEYSDLENILDMDEILRYFVVHNFVVNGDSYTGGIVHNYYLYENGGKLSMIPWDYNLSFGTFQSRDANSSVNESIDNPVSNGSVDDRPMVGWIFSDEKYTNEYHELFEEFIDRWFTNGELDKLINETAQMIRPYVEKDPTKFCTLEEFDKGTNALREFVNLRSEAVKLQLAGSDEQVDAGEINLSDLGMMDMGNPGEKERGRRRESQAD